MTFNVSYIHKSLALRWLYVTNDFHRAFIKEYTLKTPMEDVLDDLKNQDVDVIGLSVYIFNHEKSKAFIQACKQQLPHIRIMVGGPEVTYQVHDWLNYGVDAVVRGEGEFAFWDGVNQVYNPHIATQSHPQATIGATDVSLLEQMPNPYFLEFDKQDQANRYLYLEASRGCPFSCTYCMSGIEHGVRYFSLEYIKNIIQQVDSSSIKTIKFLDRTFNVQPQRALELVRMLNVLKHDVSIQLELEVSIWDKQLHDFFIHHGNRDRFRFEIGVQTFNKKTLQTVLRKQDNDKVKEVIASLTSAGYVVHADLIAGLPYESTEQFIASFHRLFEISPLEIQLGILKGLPGTMLFEQAPTFLMQFDKMPPYTIKETPWMSQADLVMMEEVALAVEKTYNRPIGKTLAMCVYKQKGNVFEYFKAVGYDLARLSHPYQLKDVFDIMLHHASQAIPKARALAAIGSDVGRWSKQKPKGIPYVVFSKEIQHKMIKDIEQRTQQRQDQWRSNSWVYPALIEDQIGYVWIVYNQATRYYYDEGANYVYEETHFTSNK